MGPRKYKRRRKLKPEELERLRSDEQDNYQYNREDVSNVEVLQPRRSQMDDSDEYLSGFDDYEAVKSPRKQVRSVKQIKEKAPRANARGRGRKTTVNNQESINSVIRNLDTALDEIISTKPLPQSARTVTSPSKTARKQRGAKATITTAVASAPPPEVNRPKMIHTKKTRVPIEDGKRKTRTFITRTDTNNKRNASNTRFRNRDEQSTASSGYEQLEYVNNVNPKREQLDYNNTLAESNLLLELAKKSVNYNPDVVSDLEEILRSPVKGRDEQNTNQYIDQNNTNDMEINYLMQTQPEESTSRSTRTSKRISSRQVARPATSQVVIPKVFQSRSTKRSRVVQESEVVYDPDPLSINIKQEKEVDYSAIEASEVFTCEMCSAVFSDRAQLLVHVPIHI